MRPDPREAPHGRPRHRPDRRRDPRLPGQRRPFGSRGDRRTGAASSDRDGSQSEQAGDSGERQRCSLDDPAFRAAASSLRGVQTHDPIPGPVTDGDARTRLPARGRAGPTRVLAKACVVFRIAVPSGRQHVSAHGARSENSRQQGGDEDRHRSHADVAEHHRGAPSTWRRATPVGPGRGRRGRAARAAPSASEAGATRADRADVERSPASSRTRARAVWQQQAQGPREV
jgi:hypothetical protein